MDQTPTAPPVFEDTQDATPSFDNTQPVEKYETAGQQILTGVEGAAHGLAGPVATYAEKLASDAGVPGLSPEEQAGREAANPWTHGLSEAAGFVAPAVLSGGLSALERAGAEIPAALQTGAKALKAGSLSGILETAGKAGSALVTKGEELSRLRSAGALALRGAIEGLGYTGSDEISNTINQRPDQTAGSVISHLTLGTMLGAGGGALFGAVHPKWSQDFEAPVGQAIQDFKNSVDGSVGDAATEAPLEEIQKAGLFSKLSKPTQNAAQVMDIASRNNWPVLEGMVSGSKEVQMAEDALLNGPPTVASIGRRKTYQEANNAVDTALDQATQSANQASETETGNTIKETLLDKLNQHYEPIKNLYQEIEPYRQAIPVGDQSTNTLSRTIGKIIEDQGLVPGSERYNYVKTFADGIGNVDNLQKLANFRTEVSKSAGPLTKDLAGIISDKLSGVEDRAISRFAGQMKTPEARDKIMQLISQSDLAKSSYSKFRDQLQELGNSLGKKKIYGPQNFMDFVDNLNPQTLAKRTFNGNNTEFATYLSKQFPEIMDTVRDYQRGVLRSEATKEGALNSKQLIKKINDLEPEMQKLLYSDGERKMIQDSGIYLSSMPKSFNPSGTAHESAFRAFFEHPTGAAIGNLRDFGIQAFIKAAGFASKGAEKEAGRILEVLGPKVLDSETNPKAFKTSVQMVMSAIKGEKALQSGALDVFRAGLPAASSVTVDKDTAQKLDDKLKKLQENPSDLFSLNGEMGSYLPDHSAAMAQTTMGAVNYLNQQRPMNAKLSPLDQDVPLTDAQKATYYRKLGIADNPLTILPHIKRGTLLPQDVATLKNTYPAYYDKISQGLMSAMTDHISQGGTIPYRTRQSLSLFLGQPLDSTMLPTSIQSIQAVFAQNKPTSQAQAQPQQGAKKSTNKLGKLSTTLQTNDQARASRSTQG